MMERLSRPWTGFGVFFIQQPASLNPFHHLPSFHPEMPISQSIVVERALPGVHSEMVDFGPRQGRTRVFAAGVAALH
jgi:hypothetical protein